MYDKSITMIKPLWLVQISINQNVLTLIHCGQGARDLNVLPNKTTRKTKKAKPVRAEV